MSKEVMKKENSNNLTELDLPVYLSGSKKLNLHKDKLIFAEFVGVL